MSYETQDRGRVQLTTLPRSAKECNDDSTVSIVSMQWKMGVFEGIKNRARKREMGSIESL